MKRLVLLLALLPATQAWGQTTNLLLNGSADDSLVNNEIPHWTEVLGTEWTQRQVNPSPFNGSSYFFPGDVPEARLAQVVDVSAFHVGIDNAQEAFHFTGYVRAFSQSPSDESNIRFEYRAAAGGIIGTDSLGPYRQVAVWRRLDTLLVPPLLTRTITVVLHSVRYNGSNNDGYYDELSLAETPLLGLAKPERKPRLALFPNPSNGLFRVLLPRSRTPHSVRIQNALGETVYETTTLTHDLTITLNQPGGLYQIWVDGSPAQRFILTAGAP